MTSKSSMSVSSRRCGGAAALSMMLVLAACGGKSSGTPGTAGQSGTSGGIAGSTAGASGTAGATGGVGATAGGGAGGGAVGGAGGTGGAAGQAGGSGGGGAAGTVAAAPCSAPADPMKPIAKLSQTGCMSATDIKTMAAIVVPYEVNSPLWSDTADKARGFVLPAGKKIHVKDCAANASECTQGTQDNGKWVMPVGTVMVKSFAFDGKIVETRLLVHADASTWNGYSYQWNEAQTEATVVPDDADPSLNNMRLKETFNTGTRMVSWTFPYRFDCGGCHTAEAGGTLGPETRQMNRTVGGTNQIDKWAAMNLFETAPAKPYQAALLLPYSGQLGTADTTPATLDPRARSYLHANCAYCHRPDGQAVNWLDFRYDTTLKNIGACGVDPMKGTVGVTGAQILKPGMPMLSTIWLRMHAPYTGDKTRMPQLATYVIDDKGTQLVSDWITSITACP
jgi:uncharacterized repeat protein (TIGR03806 family)